MKVIFILVSFLLFPIANFGQLISFDSINNVYNNHGCELASDLFKNNLDRLKIEDAEQVSQYFNGKNELRKKFINRTMPNEKRACYASMLEACTNWFIAHDLINDSIRSEHLFVRGAMYKFASEKKKAKDILDEALYIGKKTNVQNDISLMKIYRSIAENYGTMREYEKSNLYLDTISNVVFGQEAFYDKYRLFRNYSNNHVALNDYYISSIYNKMAFIYADSLNKKLIGQLTRDAALLNSNFLKYAESVEVLTGIKNWQDVNPNDYKDESNYFTLNRLGQAFTVLDPRKAKSFFELNQKVIESSGSGKSRLWQNLANQALVEIDLKNYDEAIEKSKELLDLIGDNTFEKKQQIYLALIESYNLSNDIKQSMHNIDKVESLFYNEHTLNSNLRFEVEIKYHILVLKTLRKLIESQSDFNLNLFEIIYHRADQKITNNTFDLSDDISTLSLLSKHRVFYSNALIIFHHLYNETKQESYLFEANKIIEKNKSIVLIINALKKRNKVSNNDIAEEIKIKSKIDKLEIKLENEKLYHIEKMEISDSIHRLCFRLRELYKSKKIINENIFDLNIDNIDKSITLLQYFQHEDTSFSRIVLSPKGNSFDFINLSSSEKSELNNYLIDLADHKTDITKSSIHLSEVLLPKNLDCTNELIILPDGLLSNIPFEVFSYENNLLLEKCNVSYAFSYNHLTQIQSQEFDGQNKMICFAPSYTTEDPKKSRSVMRSGETLLDLVYNKLEVDYIKDSFKKAKLIKNKNATKQNFLDNIHDSKVIHIAGHATAEESGNFIYFTNDDADYILSLPEIYDLDLKTELVTLSACESGIGKNQTSEGVLSLARGFAYAGSKSVVSTLWNVNDQSTSEIISSFYKYLSEGMKKDAALRQAKLDFLEDRPSNQHPHYWAGLIAVGDMSSLEMSDSFSKWKWGIIGCLGLTLIFGWRKLQSRRKQAV